MKRALTWRDHAAPIITNVLKEHKDSDEKTIRKALLDAYPFGERSMHPYRIWCDEIRKQRGILRKAKPDQTGQLNLF